MSFTITIRTLFLLSAVASFTAAQTSYNSKTQICCNGTVHDKGSISPLRCCGVDAYNSTNFGCCGCGLQSLDFFHQNAFSGSCLFGVARPYDLRTQTCCDNEVLDKPDPEIDYGCCKGQLYDTSVQRCCGGRILETSPGKQCCGDDVYHRESQLCCAAYVRNQDNFHWMMDFRIAAKTSNTTACCGLESFDFRTHVCCYGVVKPKKEGMDEKRTSTCCGGEPYDKSKQFCCRRTGKAKDNYTYVVFESNLYDLDADRQQCCGTSSYDFHDEICCDNYTIAKPEDAPRDQRMSCCGGQPVTNSSTQTCSRGQIFERKNSNFGVCWGQLYDRRTQWCCGQQVYDMQTQFCCGRQVFERGPNLKCCSFAGEVYDNTTHVCCSNAVKPLTVEGQEANHDACCYPWRVKGHSRGKAVG